jgi:hypothetical protein
MGPPPQGFPPGIAPPPQQPGLDADAKQVYLVFDDDNVSMVRSLEILFSPACSHWRTPLNQEERRAKLDRYSYSAEKMQHQLNALDQMIGSKLSSLPFQQFNS